MSILEPPEVTNDSDTDFNLENIENNELSINYGIYSKLRTYLYHYNLVKVKCKQIAVTWLITAFIGFGYLLSGHGTSDRLQTTQGVVFISILGTLGLLLMWFLDVIIYHRIIESIFTHQLELEEEYPSFSQTNLVIAKSLIKGHIGPVVYDGMIYSSFGTILLSIALLGVHYSVVQFVRISPFLSFAIGIAFLFLFNISIFVLSSRSSLPKLFKIKKRY